jgi:dipeptidyl aminopeptidase/acylaminoacyl peptidase
MMSTGAVALAIAIMVSGTVTGAAPAAVVTQGDAAGKSAITHESMWSMRRVGAPVPSPDGKLVVFSVTEPAYDDKDQTTDLWLVATDGKTPPRRLTATRGGESSPAWSPDGRRIAFGARREGDEASQIYIIDLGGGEASRVTSLSTGARAPKWRPDGKALLFTSTVYPGALDDEANKKIAAERKAQKYRARVYEKFPIRYWDHWLDDTQPHVFVQSLEPGAKAKDLIAGSRLVRERGFGGAPGLASEELNPTWTPDGGAVVFVASVNRDTAAYANTSTQLFVVSAEGGEPRALTAGTASASDPEFRPDGKALYYHLSAENDEAYNLTRLAMLDWPGASQPRGLTAGFDRSVGSFGFSPDSKTIYLLAEDSGHEKLYSVPAAGGEVRLVVDLKSGVYTNLAMPEESGEPVLVANWGSAISPSEIVRIDPAAGRHQALTRFNAERAAAIDWQPVREFWFTSKTGKRIHNLIALPPRFDENRKYPLLVLVHGGPAGMWRDEITYRWNYHLLAQPGYVVLLTNFTGSTGFGEKFARDIKLDPFIGPSAEVNEAADEAIRQFKFIDGGRQAAAGASYGGHLVNWLQATTTRYRCLISHAGLINLESQWGTSDGIYHREVNSGGPHWEGAKTWREQNPIKLAKNFRTPILLTVGENDFRVPLNQTLENWSVLQRMRIPSKLIVFPDENHWILKAENSRFFYREVHAWLAKYLSNTGQS